MAEKTKKTAEIKPEDKVKALETALTRTPPRWTPLPEQKTNTPSEVHDGH